MWPFWSFGWSYIRPGSPQWRKRGSPGVTWSLKLGVITVIFVLYILYMYVNFTVMLCRLTMLYRRVVSESSRSKFPLLQEWEILNNFTRAWNSYSTCHQRWQTVASGQAASTGIFTPADCVCGTLYRFSAAVYSRLGARITAWRTMVKPHDGEGYNYNWMMTMATITWWWAESCNYKIMRDNYVMNATTTWWWGLQFYGDKDHNMMPEDYSMMDYHYEEKSWGRQQTDGSGSSQVWRIFYTLSYSSSSTKMKVIFETRRAVRSLLGHND